MTELENYPKDDEGNEESGEEEFDFLEPGNLPMKLLEKLLKSKIKPDALRLVSDAELKLRKFSFEQIVMIRAYRMHRWNIVPKGLESSVVEETGKPTVATTVLSGAPKLQPRRIPDNLPIFVVSAALTGGDKKRRITFDSSNFGKHHDLSRCKSLLLITQDPLGSLTLGTQGPISLTTSKCTLITA